MINALQQWQKHLEGAKEVVVVTDHKPNTYLGLDSKPSVQLGPVATIARGRWQRVTVDVITDLPETRAGHTAFVVFVDRLSKMVHFAPCWNDTGAEKFAQMFVREIFRLHEIPKFLVSDRDKLLTSKFFAKLYDLLGIDQRMSFALHPLTDGQTERADRM